MCGGVEYQGIKVYFPNPKARLPVRLKDGGVTWVAWGSRNRADHTFPNGGWARLESIKSGKWKAWHPRPVLIVCDRFMEKDENGTSHWIDVDPCLMIQGLIAEREEKQLIYVVTEAPPSNYSWIHDRWPRLVSMNIQTPTS